MAFNTKAAAMASTPYTFCDRTLQWAMQNMFLLAETQSSAGPIFRANL